MKSTKVMALLMLALAASMNLWAQNLPRLGVVEFSVNDGAEKTKQNAVIVRNVVESQMVASNKCNVISRSDIDKLLAQQRIAASDISSSENVQKLKLMNISYIVTGSTDSMGEDYVVALKMLDVSTGRFSHSVNDYISGIPRDFYSGVKNLVNQFVGGIGVAGSSIVQKRASTAQDFLDRGKIFFDNKDYAMAIGEFTEAIKLDPNNAEYKNTLNEAKKQYRR
jgi:tetratricopeptide (TPR) repeat protein